mmetsp:Transcript_42433/g.92552  ORF Transcript_42433/g.92552 Transcript_42433/m.92552 type:complete len:247 (+) Transcript_42433:92-832(+)
MASCRTGADKQQKTTDTEETKQQRQARNTSIQPSRTNQTSTTRFVVLIAELPARVDQPRRRCCRGIRYSAGLHRHHWLKPLTGVRSAIPTALLQPRWAPAVQRWRYGARATQADRIQRSPGMPRHLLGGCRPLPRPLPRTGWRRKHVFVSFAPRRSGSQRRNSDPTRSTHLLSQSHVNLHWAVLDALHRHADPLRWQTVGRGLDVNDHVGLLGGLGAKRNTLALGPISRANASVAARYCNLVIGAR